MLAPTASATQHTASCIAENSGMREPTFIKFSLNRPNILYEVKKRSGVVEDDFSDLADELLQKGPKLPRTIIYCRRLIDCGKIFQFFDLVLLDEQYWPHNAPQIPENRLFHQYHKRKRKVEGRGRGRERKRKGKEEEGKERGRERGN